MWRNVLRPPRFPFWLNNTHAPHIDPGVPGLKTLFAYVKRVEGRQSIVQNSLLSSGCERSSVCVATL
jgi:hypothetical protein